jgi:hypothetical protein
MKKFIIILVALALFLAIMPKSTYQIEGTITNRNEITDSAGYVWEYDTNDFRVGDKVVITFQERGTTSRVDDIIKNIK